ncbi:MAG: aspartyl protease family protein [Steroidobacter sp.]
MLLLVISCQKTPNDVLRDAVQDAGAGNYEGAEDKFRWLLQKSPDDDRLKANLAFMLTKENKHAEAIALYQQLIKSGDGTYDLFAYYADSLQASGNDEEAIAWDYRALAVAPTLVDVRGKLAKLLVKTDRPYEALTLLASFDGNLEQQGHAPYFSGQRIAIQSSLPETASVDTLTMRSPKLESHFYAVVFGKNDAAVPFMIDTGASYITMSNRTLTKLGFEVPGNARRVVMMTADRRKVDGRMFQLRHIRVGPFALDNVAVVVSDNAMPLLGQSALDRFDLNTQKISNTEFLTLSQRAGTPSAMVH